jgi:hypothetical protein
MGAQGTVCPGFTATSWSMPKPVCATPQREVGTHGLLKPISHQRLSGEFLVLIKEVECCQQPFCNQIGQAFKVWYILIREMSSATPKCAATSMALKVHSIHTP